MAANTRLNYILQIIRASMYLIIGIVIICFDFPIFKNQTMKILLGVLFILYAGFRFYQMIKSRKKITLDQEE